MISVKRINKESIQPPLNPATSPIVTPMPSARATLMVPI